MLKVKKTDNPIAIRSQKLICESFLRLMYHKPYDKITITEICKGANLVRETFYRNFSSKEAIIKHILDHKFNELRKNHDSKSEISDFFIHYFSYWKNNKDFLNYLIDNHLFSIMINKTIEQIYIRVDAEIEGKETEKTKHYIASIYSGAINNLLFSWVKNDFEESPEEMSRILKINSAVFK